MPGQIRAISKLFTRYGFPIGEISAIIPKVMEKVARMLRRVFGLCLWLSIVFVHCSIKVVSLLLTGSYWLRERRTGNYEKKIVVRL